MTGHRTNPNHPIWSMDLPPRFTPAEGAYLAIRAHDMTSDLGPISSWIEDFIAEGMSAEQLVELFHLDAHMPPAVVQVFGDGLAYWVARAQEEE